MQYQRRFSEHRATGSEILRRFGRRMLCVMQRMFRVVWQHRRHHLTTYTPRSTHTQVTQHTRRHTCCVDINTHSAHTLRRSISKCLIDSVSVTVSHCISATISHEHSVQSIHTGSSVSNSRSECITSLPPYEDSTTATISETQHSYEHSDSATSKHSAINTFLR